MFAGATERIITGLGRHGVKAAALAALVAGALLGGMTGTAAAGDDWGHRHWKHRGGHGYYDRHYDRHDHWRARREWREHRHWHRPPPRVIYGPPPVIYAPPPVVYAPPPPPVYYAPRPGISFGIDIPLR